MSDFFNLNMKQRLDMQLKGLSPFNPEHVKQYLEKNGKVKASQQEAIERVRILTGEDAFNNSLGHSRETAFGNPVAPKKNVSEVDIRNQLKEDMAGYVSSGNSQLNNLLDDNVNQPTQNINTKQIADLGYKITVSYLNAFISNLKKPSSSGRIELYKSLQATIQKEQSFKNNPNALKAYQLGCSKAESELLNQLKSKKSE